MNENYIRNKIRKILSELNEQKTKEKESTKKASSGYQVMSKPVKGIGRGRFSSAIVSAKARSEDPIEARGLLKDLGVGGVGGGTPEELLLSLVKQAISGTKAMSEAYPRAMMVQDVSGRPGVLIQANVGAMGGIRNAMKYIAMTVRASINAGMLPGDFGHAKVVQPAAGDANYMVAYIGGNSRKIEWNQSLNK